MKRQQKLFCIKNTYFMFISERVEMTASDTERDRETGTTDSNYND